MKKLILAVSLITVFSMAQAQKTNYIGIAVDVGIPTGDFGDLAEVGPGGALRLLFGVSENDAISATTGYTSYKFKSLPSGVKAHFSIIPILAGYRHSFSGFYIEPQLGVGVYGARASAGGQSDSDSDSAFTWAAGLGYASNGLDFGMRYQSGKIKNADSPISVVGIHLGYNIPLGGL